ncbi:universal stress protein [Mycobacterium sp. GA-2829]|uniref:universal stress protein n=1 Tax=Mycobacterium sp. GA-2829 TaxID=1772283 RepID=UPI0009E74BD6|nr:universal stress protein [Mycobacterium sp. GA-2829]
MTISEQGTGHASTTPAQPSPRTVGVVVADDGTESVMDAMDWAKPLAEIRGLPLTRVKFDPYASVSSVIELSMSAELLVIGTSLHLRHNVTRRHTLNRLLTYADTNVAVVPQGHRPRRGAPILVAVQGESLAEHYAIGVAFEAASRLKASLTAVHCWDEPGALGFPSMSWSPIEWAHYHETECEMVAERLAGFQPHYPDVVVQRVVRSGRKGSALIPLARSARLVVVSAGGPSTGTPMRDASPSALLTDADVPILIVRNDKCRSGSE